MFRQYTLKKAHAIEKLAKRYVQLRIYELIIPVLKLGFSVGGRIQSLVFDLFSRETLFHEDFFHAGQMIALKFYSVSFYCTAACKF